VKNTDFSDLQMQTFTTTTLMHLIVPSGSNRVNEVIVRVCYSIPIDGVKSTSLLPCSTASIHRPWLV